MSVDYKIKAFPTKYRGITYRSRLEAGWAAFFDQLKWSHSYEPYDLGAWSPDFLVNGSVLVEVKPITEPDAETVRKIITACTERDALADDSEMRGALLLGVSPIPRKAGWFIGTLGSASIGVYEVEIKWCLDPNSESPRPMADLYCCLDSGWWCSVFSGECGVWDGLSSTNGFMSHHDHTMALWGHAAAAVQYKAAR